MPAFVYNLFCKWCHAICCVIHLFHSIG